MPILDFVMYPFKVPPNALDVTVNVWAKRTLFHTHLVDHVYVAFEEIMPTAGVGAMRAALLSL
jgi:hypothetical protein